MTPAITCAFLDISGVMLTDGLGGLARKRAAKHFQIDLAEIEERHHLTWDAHLEGTREGLNAFGLLKVERIIYETS